MVRYRYTAYGILIESSIHIPNLAPVKTDNFRDEPDVVVRLGKVPERLAHPTDFGVAWQAEPGKMLLSIPGVARYLIVEDREICIEPLSGSDEDVSTFLLGSVFAALLHARQMLVLHAGVVKTEGGVILVMGRGGAGKSTLVAAFHQRGYPVMSDDTAGIRLNDQDRPRCVPGIPSMRLTERTVQEIGYPARDFKLRPRLGKYVLPIQNFCDTPQPLRAAYWLNVHNREELLIERQPHAKKFEILYQQTYRRRFIRTERQRSTHFRTLGVVANEVPLVKITRPAVTFSVDKIVSHIESDLFASAARAA